ncbi:MAG: N-acetyl sugar amidotransferase [Victivallales bacterium]
MTDTKYKICARCIMDTTDPDISFDENGVCNHCLRYDTEIRPRLLSPEEGKRKLDEIVVKIKNEGKGKEYNCILGLSGGVDSAFVAYKAKELGLRPLVVHFDNGWNTEVSINNIEQIVKKLGFDLETHVMDWEEFKDIQRSFFKASVLDIELITDHSFLAALYDIASKRRIKYILEGINYSSESIMPDSWRHFKKDLLNIKTIQKKYGTMPIRNLPSMGVFKYLYYKFIQRFTCVSLLNYINYDRDEAMRVLSSEVGWKYYGNKHCESLFTYFYQAHILPLKFNIDKRKAHLSSLILSGQISRVQALKTIQDEPYPSKAAGEYKEYVAKKLGFTTDEFDEIMRMPIKSHYDYSSEEKLYKLMHKVFILFKRIGLVKS